MCGSKQLFWPQNLSIYYLSISIYVFYLKWLVGHIWPYLIAHLGGYFGDAGKVTFSFYWRPPCASYSHFDPRIFATLFFYLKLAQRSDLNISDNPFRGILWESWLSNFFFPGLLVLQTDILTCEVCLTCFFSPQTTSEVRSDLIHYSTWGYFKEDQLINFFLIWGLLVP